MDVILITRVVSNHSSDKKQRRADSRSTNGLSTGRAIKCLASTIPGVDSMEVCLLIAKSAVENVSSEHDVEENTIRL